MAEILLVAAMDRELVATPGTVGLHCGVGPVEAALATSRALTERRFSAVLNIGIAGARCYEPGAVVLGSESVYCDVLDPDATARRVARLAPDAALFARARAAMPDALVVPIATSARVGGGVGFEVEAMEGFGVMRAAQLAGVPALEIRAISNAVAEPARDRWEIDTALKALNAAVTGLVPHLR